MHGWAASSRPQLATHHVICNRRLPVFRSCIHVCQVCRGILAGAWLDDASSGNTLWCATGCRRHRSSCSGILACKLAGPVACLVNGTLTAIAPDVLCLLSNVDSREGSPDKEHPPPTLHRHQQRVVLWLAVIQGWQVAHQQPPLTLHRPVTYGGAGHDD